MRPVIGITAYAEDASWGVWKVPAALAPLAYVTKVEAAGGRPLLVPPAEDAVEETLDVLDGLVFTGGPDLDPELYDAEPHPETTNIRPERDRAEIALLAAALERDMPVLAICRGSQVLNVALGGDLEQHVPDLVGHDGHKETPGVFSKHPVSVDEGSRLHAVVGDTIEVSSHHHQGYGRLGEGLDVVGARRRRHDRGARGPMRRVRARRALAPGGRRRPAPLRGARRRPPASYRDSAVARVGRWRTASRRSGSSASSRTSAQWTGSTSSSPRARSTASWDRTARASARPSTC